MGFGNLRLLCSVPPLKPEALSSLFQRARTVLKGAPIVPGFRLVEG